jgi:HTH-type transcriptional regulator/antitoxin HigA
VNAINTILAGVQRTVPVSVVSPRYLKLIRRFPLRPLRSSDDLERATAVSLELDTRRAGLTADERDYHQVLVTLILQYEEENHPIPDVSGPAMLRCLIENRGLTQAAAARGSKIGESALSEILAGRRPMGRKTVEALARYFKVDPGLFLTRDGRDG